MNEKQMQAARDAMIEWLEHPHELGEAPAEIECAGTFELHDMTYYLFRYKREAGGDGCSAYAAATRTGIWNTAATFTARWRSTTNRRRSRRRRRWSR